MDVAKPIRPGHLRLVGPPLVLIIVFCFALVLAHPQQAEDASARTSGITASGNGNSPISDQHKAKSQAKTAPKPSSKSHAGAASGLHAGPSDAYGVSGGSDNAQPQDTSSGQGSDPGQNLQSAVQNHDSGGKPIKSVSNDVKGAVNDLTGL